MNYSTKVIGADTLIKQLRAYPELLRRETESILKQEGRALCVEYASATLPGPGFDETKDEQFRKRVEGDVRRVFASRADPNSVANMLKVINPKLFQAYWFGGVKKNDQKTMARILRTAGLPEGLDPAAHKAARTGKKGRVGKLQRPVSLANAATLNAYVKKQRALVGFAKAGWAAAAKSIGGRVRATIRNADGTRTSVERFSKTVRNLASKWPDSGGSRYTVTGTLHTLEIFSNVKHAQDAMPMPLKLSAETRAQERFIAALGHSLRALNKKLFKAA